MIQETNPATDADAATPATLCRGFVVTGRVQGVGFRAATQRQARELGVRGWVRNRTDGAVEGAAFGGHEALQRLVAWLHDGPSAAQVDSVWHSDAVDDEPAPGGFEIR